MNMSLLFYAFLAWPAK